MRFQLDDLRGRRFGRLVVVALAPSSRREKYWHVRCDCGRAVVVRADLLRSGDTKSCGCLKRAPRPAPKLARILAALAGGAETATDVVQFGGATSSTRAAGNLQHLETAGYVRRTGRKTIAVPRILPWCRTTTLTRACVTWAITPAGLAALEVEQARRSA